MEIVRALRKKIVFTFIEKIISGTFSNQTSWGFQTRDQKLDAQAPRWGRVHSVGEDVEGIVEGDYILMEPLMWTPAFLIDDQKYWATDQIKLFASSKTAPEGYT